MPSHLHPHSIDKMTKHKNKILIFFKNNVNPMFKMKDMDMEMLLEGLYNYNYPNLTLTVTSSSLNNESSPFQLFLEICSTIL